MKNEIQEAIKSLQEKMGDEEIDGSIKFEIENVGSIVIDNGDVKESEVETDCTLRGELEIFMEILSLLFIDCTKSAIRPPQPILVLSCGRPVCHCCC